MAISQQPKDAGYVEFINNLGVGITVVNEEGLKTVGSDLGFTKV